jgi:hypothetical protein
MKQHTSKFEHSRGLVDPTGGAERFQRRVSCAFVNTKAYVKTVREIDGSICLDTIHNIIGVVSMFEREARVKYFIIIAFALEGCFSSDFFVA